MAACLQNQAVYCVPRSREGHGYFLLSACVLLFLALSLKVAVRVSSTDLSYRLARETQLAIDYDIERRDLELQLTVLKRPDTLQRMAEQRLGMRPFNPDQARYILGR